MNATPIDITFAQLFDATHKASGGPAWVIDKEKVENILRFVPSHLLTQYYYALALPHALQTPSQRWLVHMIEGSVGYYTSLRKTHSERSQEAQLQEVLPTVWTNGSHPLKNVPHGYILALFMSKCLPLSSEVVENAKAGDYLINTYGPLVSLYRIHKVGPKTITLDKAVKRDLNLPIHTLNKEKHFKRIGGSYSCVTDSYVSATHLLPGNQDLSELFALGRQEKQHSLQKDADFFKMFEDDSLDFEEKVAKGKEYGLGLMPRSHSFFQD